MPTPIHAKPQTATVSNAALLAHSTEPFNAEPPLDRLRAAFITPQHLFYVRSHGTVPVLDPAGHQLTVDGRVAAPATLDGAALRARFPERHVVAALQCAGNRRADLRRVRPVSGDPWAAGAIGNAEWTGVALADVLRAAGVADAPGLHVAFTAADECSAAGEAFDYAVSIPLAKAMEGDVLLAHAMNGEPLTVEHGAPLRVVVPGYAGVRSAKWLRGITVQDGPADSPIQRSDYKLFPPDVTRETADPERGITINAMPLNSAICEPAVRARLPAGPTRVRGYATAGARRVARVDVSADGGRTWCQATLEGDPAARWSWTFWHATVTLNPGEQELAVRAWDDAGQTQPTLPDDVWNHRGYLSTAWHRVAVVVA